MARKDETHDPTNFEDQFDPNQYLSQYFNEPGTLQNYYRDLIMKMVHDFFHALLPDEKDCGKDFKVLDYGSGPVIAYAISAAGKNAVSEIVLAEYTELNRDALHKWLGRDTLAFDWSSYFKYVVQDLEKKSESEVKIREESLRSIVKVASCDIKADPPIEEGFEGPYDVVMTFLAIESDCESEVEYYKRVEEFSNLVKSEGHVLMFAKLAKTARSISYNVGEKRCHYFALSEHILLSSLKKAGFIIIHYTHVPNVNAIPGLSALEIAQLEAHLCTGDDLFYMSVTAKKAI